MRLALKIGGFAFVGGLATVGAVALVFYLVPLLFFAACLRYLSRASRKVAA